MRIPELFTFPNPVNEKAARAVAGGVLILVLVALTSGWFWLSIVLAAGFLTRVAAGPRFSPLGQLATRVIAPRLGAPKFVPGPPKRFAQAVGAVVSTAAMLAWLLGSPTLSAGCLVLLLVAATLEAVFAICLGCIAFGWLMRIGLIPADTCEACTNVRARMQHAR